MTRVAVSAPVISPATKRAAPSVRTVMVWLLTLILAAGWFAFLRPTIWGGPLTYVVIRGTSMRPTYQPGDLVLVRREANYGPGDIVAYRVPNDDIASDLILIHRIIGGSGEEGFTLLGDNNPEEDIWYPTNSDIVGRPVFHIPAVGLILTFLRAPLVLASLAAGATVAIVLVPKSSDGGPAQASTPESSGRHVRRRRIWRLRLTIRHGAHVEG
ncbi:MAG TPA: signal peptidase I [Acidimicrobiia bacterium]